MGNNRRRKKKSRTGLYICLTFIILFFFGNSYARDNGTAKA